MTHLMCFLGGSLVATPFWLFYFPFHLLHVLICLYLSSPSFSTRTHYSHITPTFKYVIASCLHLLSCLNTPFLLNHRFCYLNNICHSGGKAYISHVIVRRVSCDFRTKRSELLFLLPRILTQEKGFSLV